jgi:hypothetical protein
MRNFIPTFDEFVNENLMPIQIEQAAKDLAYSMANHSSPDKDGNFSDEQIRKAFKYFPNLKYARGKQIEDIVKRAQKILSESEVNEGKIVIHKEMNKAVKTPFGKGGPRSTVILGKTSSGLEVTINGDFVNAKDNVYVTNPTDQDKDEAKEMAQYHHDRLTGGLNKEKLAKVLKELSESIEITESDDPKFVGAVHTILGPKQARLVVSGDTVKTHKEKILTVIRKVEPTAKAEFYEATGKIVGVIAQSNLRPIQKEIERIDKKIVAEIKNPVKR